MSNGTAWWRYALLGVALIAITVTTLAPHVDPTNGRSVWYPVHMDEYAHWGAELAIRDSHTLDIVPFHPGGGAFSIRGDLHERGYQAFISTLQEASGIPYITLLVWMPLVVAWLLALLVFALAERWGAGAESALWLAAIPTTLRFLGPSFAVPIVFSLPLVTLGAIALFHGRGWRSICVVGLVAAALWPIHAMGAITMLMLTGAVGILELPKDAKRSVALLCVVILPFAIAWPYYAGLITPQEPASLPAAPEVLARFGVAPLVLAAVGAAVLTWRDETRVAGITLGSLLLVAEGVLVNRLASGVDPLRLYDRAHMIVFLVAAILAGVAVAAVARAAARLARRHGRALAAAAFALVLVVSGALVATSARRDLGQEYYTVMSDAQHAAYEQAASTTRISRSTLALVDGISGMAFSDVAGASLYFVYTPGTSALPPEFDSFFAQGSRDTAFLVATGTTIVVTDRPVTNEHLSPIAPGVYQLTLK